MAWDQEKERKAGKTLSIGSCVLGLVFCIFWCIMAVFVGARFMLFFGIPLVGMMCYRLYVLIRVSKENPGQKKERDPWEGPGQVPPAAPGNNRCPYCASPVKSEFEFCPTCGRRLKK